jgi:predicted 2-oxoglutarate/Fe(II)-dependent dioxygenase YbiX
MHKIKVIENFVSEEDRKLGIELFDNAKAIPFRDNPDASVAEFTPEIWAFLKKYSDKALDAHKEYRNLKIPVYTHEAFLTMWGKGSSAPEHIDNHIGFEFVQLSSVIYLNDEFEGGEIFFPEFDFSHKPKVGDLIIFPAFTKDHAYNHGVTEVTSGKRYTIGMWHTQFEKYAETELHQELKG